MYNIMINIYVQYEKRGNGDRILGWREVNIPPGITGLQNLKSVLYTSTFRFAKVDLVFSTKKSIIKLV